MSAASAPGVPLGIARDRQGLPVIVTRCYIYIYVGALVYGSGTIGRLGTCSTCGICELFYGYYMNRRPATRAPQV
jgi:hypothetical protein